MGTQHILVAESRPNLQHSLGLMLKQAHYRISLAETTKDALAKAKALVNTPDAVDLLIFDLDAASPEACFTFMHALSASTLALPYLVLAEEIHEQTVDTLKKHGCLACITKPFEPATLLQSTHEALARLSPRNGHLPGRRSEKNSTENPANQPGQPLSSQGEQLCRTNCCATGFHSCSLPRFW